MSWVSVFAAFLVAHMVGDYLFQTDWQARNKRGGLSGSAVARRALMIPAIDLRPLLPQIRQPVLMLCGDRDPIVPLACEAPLLEGLPNVMRVEFPDCGHYPQYTHAPLVAELVRQFLTKPGQ